MIRVSEVGLSFADVTVTKAEEGALVKFADSTVLLKGMSVADIGAEDFIF